MHMYMYMYMSNLHCITYKHATALNETHLFPELAYSLRLLCMYMYLYMCVVELA